MSSLANLAPIPTRKVNIIQKDINGSDDEFDAMLGDMLDSPSHREPVRSSKQKNHSSKRGQSKKNYDDASLDSTMESISFPANVNTLSSPAADSGPSRKPGKNVLDDPNELSMDSNNGLLMNITANTDDLEDSILGGLLKSKTRSTKQAFKPGNVSSSSKLSASTRNTKTKDTWGASSSPNQSGKNFPLQENLESGGISDDFPYDSRDKDKRGSTVAGNSVLSASSVTKANQLAKITKKETSKYNYESEEVSDDDEEEEESGYQPSISVRKPNQNQTQSPHPPAALYPSSSNLHSAVEIHSSSVSKNVPAIQKNVPEGHGLKSDGNMWGIDEKEAKKSPWSSSDADNDLKTKDTDQVDIGFVPSFLEPGRQPRQKRNLGGPMGSQSMVSGAGSKVPDSLDELDFALGFEATAASKQATAGGNKVVADPFLNAGSISSGTSLGGRFTVGEKPRFQVAESSDSDNDQPVRSKKTSSASTTLGSAPSLGSPHGVSGGSGLFPKTISESSAASLSSVALPSLARSPSSVYGDRGVASLKVPVEYEDELDVSGIVRKQSDEDYGAGDKEKQNEKNEKSEKFSESKKPHINNSSSTATNSSGGGGSARTGYNNVGESLNLSVDTRSPHTQKRSSSITSSYQDEPISSIRRDKIVSFDASSPRAVHASLKGALSGLSIGESTYTTFDPMSPRGAASPSGASTPTTSSSSAQIFRLQHCLEEAHLQRDASERSMRLEVDSLKARLLSQTEGWGAGVWAHNSQIQDMQTEHEKTKSKLLDELNDLRRKVSQLEGEVSRHTDEAIIQAMKHREEIKYMQDRREGELSDVERRKDEEVKCIERRHSDVVCALKQVHVDELQAIRERARDGVALNQLAGQMKQTSGSIKLLEENLNARYKGLEAVKEGQLEARERLLSEMEQKARERVEAAEVESYRLKGLLVHMEHVAGTLRGQGGEETERLRQEHQRLQIMQTSLESERVAMQARAAEETASLRQKARDVEAEARRGLEERRSHESREEGERLRLDADRADFAAHVSSASRAAEAGANQLKEEEARLKRVREDLADQKAQFDKKKQAASADIQAAEQVKRSIAAAKEDLTRERQQIERMARDFQIATDRLSLKGEALEVAERALAEREGFLLDGIASMQSEAVVLSRREADVRDSARVVDHHRASMEDEDRALTHKRIEAAAIQRTLSGRQAAATMTSLLTAPSYTHSDFPSSRSFQLEGSQQATSKHPSSGPVGDFRSTAEILESGSGSVPDFLSQLRNRNSGLSPKLKVSLSPADRQQNALEDQALSSAKQVLQNVRGQLSRSSGDRLEMNRFIEQESAFLGSVQKRAAFQ